MTNRTPAAWEGDLRAAPAWQEVKALFARHGLSSPPVRLRDEIVMILVRYRNLRDAARVYDAVMSRDIPVGDGYARWVHEARAAREELRDALES